MNLWGIKNSLESALTLTRMAMEEEWHASDRDSNSLFVGRWLAAKNPAMYEAMLKEATMLSEIGLLGSTIEPPEPGILTDAKLAKWKAAIEKYHGNSTDYGAQLAEERHAEFLASKVSAVQSNGG